MKTNLFRINPNIAVSILALAAILVAGCTTTSKPETKAKFSFYPPPPEEPRLQFLTSFEGSKDFPNSGGSKFMTYLTGKKAGTMLISKPYGGAAGKGLFYVCDTGSGAVMRLNLVQRKMDAIVGAGPVTFAQPVNMAVDDDGSLYVVDMGLNNLIIVDRDENLIGQVGEKGKNKPMDVALTKDRIYLSDAQTRSVHVLDKATRTKLFDIPRGTDATNKEHMLYQPINIALDKQGCLYVSDLGADEIMVYDGEGKYLRTIGGRGDNFGEFTRPKGVAVDRDNLLYVVEAAGQLVQMFDTEGHLLMWFGEQSRNRVSLFLPSKVILDYDDVALFEKYAAPNFKVEHLVIVMNQFGPMKVAVFGFGHKK